LNWNGGADEEVSVSQDIKTSSGKPETIGGPQNRDIKKKRMFLESTKVHFDHEEKNKMLLVCQSRKKVLFSAA